MKRHFFNNDEMPYYISSEVEEELEKARREGEERGYMLSQKDSDIIRAEERKLVLDDVDRVCHAKGWHPNSIDALMDILKSRPAQEPKPLSPIIDAMQQVQRIFDKAIEELRNSRR